MEGPPHLLLLGGALAGSVANVNSAVAPSWTDAINEVDSEVTYDPWKSTLREVLKEN